jgi:general secretion pathway protein B
MAEASPESPEWEPSAAPGAEPAEGRAATATPVVPQPSAPKVPTVAELPDSVRAQLPQTNINVHVYTEQPNGRFVLIDLRRYTEGSALPNGLRLERITPNGVVLNFQGHSFLIEVR